MKNLFFLLLLNCSAQVLNENNDQLAELPKAPKADKIISFTEGGKTFQGKIYLPKNQKSLVSKVVMVVHE